MNCRLFKMGRDLWLRTNTYQSYVCQPSSKHRHKGNATSKSNSKRPPVENETSLWQKLFQERSDCHPQSEFHADLMVYALVVAVCFACYANSLNGDFVHDDLVAVTSNPDVVGKSSMVNLLANDFWGKPMSDPSSHKSYRPLTVFTFRLNYILCGFSPWSYHLVNIFLHAAVCVLIVYLCLELLCWPRADCATAALLFATHPVHTEAVSNIVGRAEVLSAFFFLTSFLSFTKSSKKTVMTNKETMWLVSSLVCAVLALLAKEQGIAVLPVCITWRVLQLIRNLRFTQPRALIKKGLYFLSDAIFWITLIMLVMLVTFRLGMLQGTMPNFSDEDNPASFCTSALTRFYTYCFLAAFNTWLLLNPKTLSYDWQMGSLPLVNTTSDARNIGSVMLLLFLLCLALRLVICALYSSTPSKKSEANTFLVSLSVLILPFLPASNLFVTVGFVVAERVLYIPSIGFCILVAFGLMKLRRKAMRLSWFWKALPIFFIAIFFARTIVRNGDWNSRETLFKSGLRSVPHNAKVHYNFANLQKDLGNVDTAVAHYKVALKLWPNHASAHNNLGTLLTSAEEAEKHFRSALVINPHHPRALFNLASLYSKQDKTAIAQQLLQRVLELDSEFTEAYSSLAYLIADTGQKEEAENLHIQAISVDPHNADTYNNYGIFLQKSGRIEEAVQQYKEAVRIQPNHTVAIVNAARSLRSLKNNREAELFYKRALAIKPEPKIMDNLGVLYISAGRIHEASLLYQDMQLHYGDYVEGKVHFAQVLIQERSFRQAEKVLQAVVETNSTYRDALHQLSLLYSQVNRTTEALDYILKALNFCPAGENNCAQLHVDHGDILKDMKHLDAAAESYLLAIHMDPKLSHAHVNLAVIKHLQGDCHKALLHYHEAYVLDPENQLLQENMRKLKLHLLDGSGSCHGDEPSACKSR